MYSLLNHNTFRLDVKAKYFLEYDSVEELKQIIASEKIHKPYIHIGEGSNLLFTKDYEGTILHSKMRDITILEENEDYVIIKVGSGVIWDKFVEYCVDNNFYGAENLSLIPGEVGASAVQNIGAYGSEVCDIISLVETCDIEGRERTFSVEECNYSYRYSIFKEKEYKRYFVTNVVFKLSKKEEYKIEYGAICQKLGESLESLSLKKVRDIIINIRREKLPDHNEIGNAGSFFMNPVVDISVLEHIKTNYPDVPHYLLPNDKVKIPAGWLIEQCGWKGKTLGRAGVYHKQALVIINTGGASSEDIISIAEEIQKSVIDKFNIKIVPEVNYI